MKAPTKRTRSLSVALAVCAGLLLTACGGDKTAGSSQVPKASAEANLAQPTTALPSSEETRALLAKGAALNTAELQRAAQTTPRGFDAGKSLATAAAANRVSVHRFYNPQTGVHFYTASDTEKASVQANLPQFLYEGVSSSFFASGATAAGLSPVYRFFNGQTGAHFYTISEDEKASMLASLPLFSLEGVAFYSSQTPGTDLLPVYRFYNNQTGAHFYTTSDAEKASVLANLPQFTFEGIGYYVLGPNWGLTTGLLPHSGVTDQQCYETDSDTLVACNTAGADALNLQQDGDRTAINPMAYSAVPNTMGGSFPITMSTQNRNVPFSTK